MFLYLLQPIQDPDPLLTCDLMDGRDAFLTLARDKHYEFSSLRRAQFSTLSMLYELHNQGQDKFVYTCNNCKTAVETRYHCTVCDVRINAKLLIQIRLDSFYANLRIYLGMHHLTSGAYYVIVFLLYLRTLICALCARRRLDIRIKWRNLVSIWMMVQRLRISNRPIHRRHANNPSNVAFNLWSMHVSVAMPIVVYPRARR